MEEQRIAHVGRGDAVGEASADGDVLVRSTWRDFWTTRGPLQRLAMAPSLPS